MALGFKGTIADELLDALLNADAYTGPAAIWVKLHTGDPGAAGASNAATNTTRKQASFPASSGGTCTTDADLTWTSVAGTEDYSHFSLWDASTAGNFLGSGLITANAVTAGDTFTIPSGSLSVSLSVAA